MLRGPQSEQLGGLQWEGEGQVRTLAQPASSPQPLFPALASGERWVWRWGQPGQGKCSPSLAPPALPLGWVACMREAPPGCRVGGRSGRGSDLRSLPTPGPLHMLIPLPDFPFHRTHPLCLAKSYSSHEFSSSRKPP